MQYTLFDTAPAPAPEAHARHTDPETSHLAAAALPADTITARQLAVLAVFCVRSAMTDEQMLDQYQQSRPLLDLPVQSQSGLRTRRSELVHAGLLRDSGLRSLTASGRQAIIWTLTGAGGI